MFKNGQILKLTSHITLDNNQLNNLISYLDRNEFVINSIENKGNNKSLVKSATNSPKNPLSNIIIEPFPNEIIKSVTSRVLVTTMYFTSNNNVLSFLSYLNNTGIPNDSITNDSLPDGSSIVNVTNSIIYKCYNGNFSLCSSAECQLGQDGKKYNCACTNQTGNAVAWNDKRNLNPEGKSNVSLYSSINKVNTLYVCYGTTTTLWSDCLNQRCEILNNNETTCSCIPGIPEIPFMYGANVSNPTGKPIQLQNGSTIYIQEKCPTGNVSSALSIFDFTITNYMNNTCD